MPGGLEAVRLRAPVEHREETFLVFGRDGLWGARRRQADFRGARREPELVSGERDRPGGGSGDRGREADPEAAGHRWQRRERRDRHRPVVGDTGLAERSRQEALEACETARGTDRGEVMRGERRGRLHFDGRVHLYERAGGGSSERRGDDLEHEVVRVRCPITAVEFHVAWLRSLAYRSLRGDYRAVQVAGLEVDGVRVREGLRP